MTPNINPSSVLGRCSLTLFEISTEVDHLSADSWHKEVSYLFLGPVVAGHNQDQLSLDCRGRGTEKLACYEV